MMKTMPAGWGDPLDTVLEEGGPYHARGRIKADNYRERLEQTGRGEQVAELKKRHPGEFQ
jgi:choline-sulfatase